MTFQRIMPTVLILFIFLPFLLLFLFFFNEGRVHGVTLQNSTVWTIDLFNTFGLAGSLFGLGWFLALPFLKPVLEKALIKKKETFDGDAPATKNSKQEPTNLRETFNNIDKRNKEFQIALDRLPNSQVYKANKAFKVLLESLTKCVFPPLQDVINVGFPITEPEMLIITIVIPVLLPILNICFPPLTKKQVESTIPKGFTPIFLEPFFYTFLGTFVIIAFFNALFVNLL